MPMDFADNLPEEDSILQIHSLLSLPTAKDIVHELRHCNSAMARYQVLDAVTVCQSFLIVSSFLEHVGRWKA